MITDRLESVLALMSLPGVGRVRLQRILSGLEKAGIAIEDAWTEEGRLSLARLGVNPLRIPADVRSLAERLRRAEMHCCLTSSPVLTLSSFSRANLPPVLFVRGPIELLGAPSIGFCGSRSATERGLSVAADIAQQAADHSFNVVSGGAKGVDIATHRAALAYGGTTTVVVAEGILEYRMRMELREMFDPARTLIVSEFLPEDRWMAGRAMQRNRTICALSRALVLIEARSTGGTFAAGESALGLGLPLFTADYSAKHEGNDGNRLLLERGAIPMRQSRTTGRANVGPLIAIASRKNETNALATNASPAAEQQDLWTR